MHTSHLCRFLLWVLLSLSPVVLHAQDETNTLVGVWKSGQFGDPLVLELNANGTGTFDGVPLQYEVDHRRLMIRLKGHETLYTYSFNHSQLMLSGGDLESPLTFTREAPRSEEPSLLALSDALIGLWSGDGELIEFRADGKCRYDGKLFTYRLSQGHIILEISTGNLVFEYTLSKETLMLTIDGQRSAFTRLTSASSVVATRKEDRNPTDLVGQWCYLTATSGTKSGRCMTLNADGTYLYTSERSHATDMTNGSANPPPDSGTWFVNGDRLYYQSLIKGSGYYKLERRNHPGNTNEPMIVLNNEPFVAVGGQPPWR